MRSYARTKKPHIKVHFLFNFICIKRSKLVKSKDRSRGVRWGLEVAGNEKKLRNNSEVLEQVGLCNSVAPDNITASLSSAHFKIVNFIVNFAFMKKSKEGYMGVSEGRTGKR